MKCKQWWGAGLLALAVIFVWARGAASWRPKTFAKVEFAPSRILFSRDTKRLIVADVSGNTGEKAIFDVKSGALDESVQAWALFDGDFYGATTFPRVRWNRPKNQLYFSPTPKIDALLQGIPQQSDRFVSRNQNQRVRAGWSKARSEVYGESAGVIYIWNWDTGALKRRVRYGKVGVETATFSPDGKWLLAVQPVRVNNGLSINSDLGRYDVQTGKLMEKLTSTSDIHPLRWSPNGRYFYWQTALDGFDVMETGGWSWVYGALNGPGAPQWIASDRIGYTTLRGFEVADLKTRRVVSSLPGPNSKATDWTLSPDGNWIYSCEKDGTIRVWRAR